MSNEQSTSGRRTGPSAPITTCLACASTNTEPWLCAKHRPLGYRLHVYNEYHRDSPTGGTATEWTDEDTGQVYKSWNGSLDDCVLFDSPADAWAWLGIDPYNLPADETFIAAEGNPDGSYTRTVRFVGGKVIVTDTPTTEWFSSSRRVRAEYSVQEVTQ